LFTKQVKSRKQSRASLVVCAVFRDEAKFLEEWIAFHVNQGISHFYLYNDGSSDGFIEVLGKWISRGLVTLRDTNGANQEEIYSNFIDEFGNSHDWVAFIDVDEFLYAKNKKKKLPDELEYYKNYSGVAVFWTLFGSSGTKSLEGKSVTKTLTHGLRWPRSKREVRRLRQRWLEIRGDTVLTGNPVQFKSILRPNKIRKMGIHFARDLEGPNVDVRRRAVNPDLLWEGIGAGAYLPKKGRILLNHYWSRSIEDLELKIRRPGASKSKREGKRESLDQALEWDSKICNSHQPALSNRSESAPHRHIFFIGFNKSATNTIAAFFQEHGYNSVHWDGNRLVERMLSNIYDGMPIFEGYASDFVVFTDMIFASENEIIEGNHFYKTMESDYPDALFVFNNRNSGEWLASRGHHGRSRHGYPRFLQMSQAALGGLSEDHVFRFWTELKSSFEAEVREHFKNSPKFLEIDIADPQAPNHISEFTGLHLDTTKWGHLNTGTYA
jgi:hypothetical protein